MLKMAMVVGLVLVILLLGIPMAHGADMLSCPACRTDGTADAVGMCLAILGLLTLLAPVVTTFLTARSPRIVPLLIPTTIDRPPRLA